MEHVCIVATLKDLPHVLPSDPKWDMPKHVPPQDRAVTLGLCPGAEYGTAKRWLPERFAEAAAAISTQSKAKWILFGTRNDKAIGETIATALGENCVNRIGQTTLDELIVRPRMPARAAAATWLRMRASSGETMTVGPHPAARSSAVATK